MTPIKLAIPDTDSDEYKIGNAKLFSLNDILAYSTISMTSSVSTLPDNTHEERLIVRSLFEAMAKERYEKEQQQKKDHVDSIPDGGFSGDY